ncbi:MAG: FHA domain-containing serine/threonine-protein kinase [Anaerolineae bacterium]
MAASVPLPIMVGGRIVLDIGAAREVEMLELLGAGGFGSAWKVVAVDSGLFYVLKIIQGIIPGSVRADRVRLEAEVSIPSEYIVPVLGLTQWDAQTFLILFGHFPGRSLDKILAERALTRDQKRRIFKEVLLGVSDAHHSNVIHRDLKPGNILVSDDGHAKLIDFGISKFRGSGLTVTGEFLGTLPYTAPETILRGSKVADARTDIYSLGHILYELAMGQHFWVRRGWTELRDFVSYLTQSPPPEEGIDLSDFSTDMYANADGVLRQMVKLDPEARYCSVDDILADLDYFVPPPPLPADLHLRHPLLIVESGSNRGARTLLALAPGESIVLGRADIAGSDSSISRVHLELSRADDRYRARDLNSKNGTMISGLALTAGGRPMELKHGDRIKVGDVFLRFVFLRAPAV